MRALSCAAPGNLVYENIPEPVGKKGYSILKVKRVGVCGTDLHAYDGMQPYFTYPRILGHELACEIVDTEEPDFHPSEQITITPYFYCGKCIACRTGRTNCCSELQVFGVHIDGGMSDYISVPSYTLIHAPGLGLEELALTEPLAIGAHAIRRADIREKDFVLIAGAGPIGLGVAEFARISGAQVIMIDVNEDRLEFCRQNLSIPYILNAASNDLRQQLEEITRGDMPSVVIDATGNQKAINNLFQYMAHSGKYILVGLQKDMISFSHPEFHKREATLMSSRNATKQDFQFVIEAVKKKLIDPNVFITHRIPFSRIKDEFASLTDPDQHAIKAIINLD